MLAPPEYAPFFSWLTGWFNFVGQVSHSSGYLIIFSIVRILNSIQFAVTTGISFGLAGLISTTATINNDYTPTPGKTVAIYLGVLVSHGMVNTFGVKILRYLNNVSIILHSLGVAAFAIAVVAKAPTHQSARDVFAKFYDVSIMAHGGFSYG